MLSNISQGWEAVGLGPVGHLVNSKTPFHLGISATHLGALQGRKRGTLFFSGNSGNRSCA